MWTGGVGPGIQSNPSHMAAGMGGSFQEGNQGKLRKGENMQGGKNRDPSPLEEQMCLPSGWPPHQEVFEADLDTEKEVHRECFVTNKAKKTRATSH